MLRAEIVSLSVVAQRSECRNVPRAPHSSAAVAMALRTEKSLSRPAKCCDCQASGVQCSDASHCGADRASRVGRIEPLSSITMTACVLQAVGRSCSACASWRCVSTSESLS